MGASERIRTYVAGFDEKLSGGIPPRSIVLLAGEAGTMKSTVAWNVLFHGAQKDGRTGAYITIEQGRENFASHLRGMGMDPKEVEDKVSIVDLGMIRKHLEGEKQTWYELFQMYATNLKRTLGFDLLVIDSLPVLETMARFESPREDLFRLFEWIRDLEATVFMIQEMSTPSDPYGRHGEEFLADGILAVKMQAVDDANIQRRIRCVKLRATAHSPNFYTLIYQNGLFQVTRVLGD